MTALLDRLRTLRQQAGVGGTAPRMPIQPMAMPRHAPAALRHVPVPATLRRQLDRRESATRPNTLASPLDRTLPGEEIAPGLHYREWRHAPCDLPETLYGDPAGVEPMCRAHLLAFDTETTGLAGGTGTRAFMIGAADVVGDGLRIRQLTMTTLAAETAMLRTFAGWLTPVTVLASYNGKSYDAPLLATRYRLARINSPLLGLRHLDLLYPVRRLWRGVWENCRLATAEREWLGVVREDDLPGAEAPRAWRHYLHGGSSADLNRVAEHNAQDLRSVVGLLGRISELAERRRDGGVLSLQGQNTPPTPIPILPMMTK